MQFLSFEKKCTRDVSEEIVKCYQCLFIIIELFLFKLTFYIRSSHVQALRVSFFFEKEMVKVVRLFSSHTVRNSPLICSVNFMNCVLFLQGSFPLYVTYLC